MTFISTAGWKATPHVNQGTSAHVVAPQDPGKICALAATVGAFIVVTC